MAANDEDLTPPDGTPLSEAAANQLAFRYGHAARNVLKLAGEQPELAAPIVDDRPDLLAEAAIAARAEQARSVADVMLRRTRLGILAAPSLREAAAVEPVAAAMGAELGWSDERVREEAARWPAEMAAEGVDPAGAA
jgi:glycerol-3-phosphate dehydrogenase